MRTPSLIAVVSCAVALAGCDVLTTTQMPASYVTGQKYLLAGGTGGDDAWLLHPASGAPVLLHFDGKAWSEVSLAGLEAIIGHAKPVIYSSATASKGALFVVLADLDRVFRLDATGLAEEVSAGLPLTDASVKRRMNHLGEPVLVSSFTAMVGTSPGHPTLHRREGSAWVPLPDPPGPVGEIRVLPGGVVWVSGWIPQTAPNQPGVSYFASLEGSSWRVTTLQGDQTSLLGRYRPSLVLGPGDLWTILEVGSGSRPWSLAHFDGTTWTQHEAALPQSYADLGISYINFAIVDRGGGRLAMLGGTIGKELYFSEWDGTTLGDPIRIGPFESGCISMCTGAEYANFAGQLPDGTLMIQELFGRVTSMGKLPPR